MNYLRFALAAITLLATTTLPAADNQTPQLVLKKGDHISLIGNTLPERMQYFGHFETLLQAQFPQHQLSVRNLGFSADELNFRPRSMNFGEPDVHLTMQQTDVILAFFGFNESFKGPQGLVQFEVHLRDFVKHTLSQKYNGTSPPRLVLVSPIAHEKLKNKNLPDGEKNNANISLYTQTLSRVAKDLNVGFVDLFNPTKQIMKNSKTPFTFNGVHLTDSGYKRLAPVLLKALVGKSPGQTAALKKILAEVKEKDYQFFNRYRAVNGYYVYGERNRVWNNEAVMENERKKLDEMCAIRDARIWKVARGESVSATIDDSGTRSYLDVPTNFNQDVNILPPEEAIKKFTIAEGYKINLFASEVEFPDIENPVQMNFDAQGRLWVSTMPSYPGYQPPNKPNDKILVLEDTDGDGKADKQTVFADKLHVPTGFELGDGGVYVAQQPNLIFLKDTDGDGKADVRKLLLHGFDSGDTHHAIGAFTWGPGGGLYMHEGTFFITGVETPYGPVRNAHGGIYRYDARNEKMETFVHYNFANPWGHVFDKWGQNFVADASGGANYFGTAFSTKAPQYEGQDDFGPFKFKYQEKMEQFFPKRVRPTAGCELVSSRHFPPEAQGNYLLNNVIGFQGILQHTVKEKGSGFVGKEIEPILFSSDRNFRPTDLQFGPDGALYVVDWFNPLIGHLQHSLRDPNRDYTHGRIWRITYPSRPLVKYPKVDGEPIPALLDLLRTYEDRTRYRVRLELREHPAEAVVAETDTWIAALDKNDTQYEHLLLEALWVKQHNHDYDQDLLERVLRSPDYHARAAATRVLGFWRDDVNDSLALLRVQANDDHPRVRLEAVRAASYFEHPSAAEIALDTLKHETDYYLTYTLKHTMRALEPYWKPSIASGRPFAADNPQGAEYILSSLGTEDLVVMARSKPVYEELLTRNGVARQFREEALRGLARLNKSDVMSELLETINTIDNSKGMHAEHVLADLSHIFTMQSPKAIAGYRKDIEQLARSAKMPITRQIAYVAMISTDKSADKAWQQASQSVENLTDFVNAVPLIPDAELRASLHDKVAPLLHRLPAPLAKKAKNLKGLSGRYVRIELPGRRRTLTLAEVEVISDGRNVARQGKAKQKNTSSGGEASRGIDGNTSGTYNDGGQTHSQGSTRDPWWEVDLMSEQPIEAITIWNRSENNGNYVSRLEGFTLTVLDKNRKPVYSRKGIPAPRENVTLKLKGDPVGAVRRAAINAVISIPGHEAEAFVTLSNFVKQNQSRATAVSAISRIPRAKLPQKSVRPLVDTLVAYIESIPVKERTRNEVMEAIQLGKDLSLVLPKAQGKVLLTHLRKLGVDVFFIRPIPHKMMYDRTKLFVEAGKPFEIIFENTDIMPHNLVVTAPGAREEVGILAEKMGATPEGFARHFIPDTNKVISATGMLQTGQQQRLRLNAPTALGDYPFVCTFPGHWRTMFGTIHVVADISEIPLDQLDATPKQDGHDHHAAPVRAFVRKWQPADLLASLSQLDKNRSHENARNLFKTIACGSCHQIKGEGGKVGPDLTELKKKFAEGKMTREKLLTELLQPSKVIDEKFQTRIIVTEAGKLYSGVIVYQDKKVIHLMANPLEKDVKPIEIAKDEIDEQTTSKVSLMPEGLVNTLTRDDILDLLLFLENGGDAK